MRVIERRTVELNLRNFRFRRFEPLQNKSYLYRQWKQC